METQARPARDNGTGNYLVLTDQKATGPALLEHLRQVAAHDREAKFTLLVPAKPVARSLVWTEGESIAAARRMANEASLQLEKEGIRVVEAMIGDASPVQAIADILVERGPFHGTIVCTQPRRISR